MSEAPYPTKCTKCGKPFRPGDKFFYDVLDDSPELDDRCEACAGKISMMEHGTIPKSTKTIRS